MLIKIFLRIFIYFNHYFIIPQIFKPYTIKYDQVIAMNKAINV